MRSDYDCPECEGTGEMTCACCGNEQTCDVCDGGGFDRERIDVDRLDKDTGDAGARWNGSAALYRDGKEIGRQSINRALAKGPQYADEVIYYADYAYPKEAPDGK